MTLIRGWRQARDQLHEWVNCADPQPIDGKYNGTPTLPRLNYKWTNYIIKMDFPNEIYTCISLKIKKMFCLLLLTSLSAIRQLGYSQLVIFPLVKIRTQCTPLRGITGGL